MFSSSVILLEETLPDHEEIAFISFLEDIVPKYIILIINDTKVKSSRLYLKQIKKNDLFFDTGKDDESP